VKRPREPKKVVGYMRHLLPRGMINRFSDTQCERDSLGYCPDRV
jgi:hypothetical protein